MPMRFTSLQKITVLSLHLSGESIDSIKTITGVKIEIIEHIIKLYYSANISQ